MSVISVCSPTPTHLLTSVLFHIMKIILTWKIYRQVWHNNSSKISFLFFVFCFSSSSLVNSYFFLSSLSFSHTLFPLLAFSIYHTHRATQHVDFLSHKMTNKYYLYLLLRVARLPIRLYSLFVQYLTGSMVDYEIHRQRLLSETLCLAWHISLNNSPKSIL